MEGSKKAEIVCSACGAETLLLRKPRYEGFKKIGEILCCASCGHEYESESAVPFKDRPRLQVFSKADRSAELKVFREEEKGRLCRYCSHYVVHPFVQWCAAHRKEVEATDTCDRFLPKPQKG